MKQTKYKRYYIYIKFPRQANLQRQQLHGAEDRIGDRLKIRHKGTFKGNGNVLKLNDVLATQLYKFTKDTEFYAYPM